MTASIVIGILVAAGESQTPGTAAMLATLSEALGPGPSIVVREVMAPSDADALLMETQLHSGAVVTVVENIRPSAGRTIVNVRVHVAEREGWVDRKVAFLSSDTAIERRRAIGFTIASILLSEIAAVPDTRKTPPSEPPPERRGPASFDGAEADVSSSVSLGPPASPGHDAAHETIGERFAVDLTALGTTGLGGPAGGFGLASHLEFALTRAIWARIGGGARTGTVSGLGGDDVAAWATAGGAWRSPPLSAAATFRVAVCLDGGVVFHDLSHTRADRTTAHLGRSLPEATLTLQGSWRLARSWEAIAALAGEIAFGVTEIWVATRPVATVPAVRGVAAVGVRFGS